MITQIVDNCFNNYRFDIERKQIKFADKYYIF